MPIKDMFKSSVIAEMKKNHEDVLMLREELVYFKNQGMNKEEMLECMEELRRIIPEYEDVLCDLLDFISGFCNSDLSIFAP